MDNLNCYPVPLNSHVYIVVDLVPPVPVTCEGARVYTRCWQPKVLGPRAQSGISLTWTLVEPRSFSARFLCVERPCFESRVSVVFLSDWRAIPSSCKGHCVSKHSSMKANERRGDWTQRAVTMKGTYRSRFGGAGGGSLLPRICEVSGELEMSREYINEMERKKTNIINTVQLT